MKVAFYGHMHYADNEICLLRQFQQKGIDVIYYMEMPCWGLKATLFDIKRQDNRCDILPASTYKEFHVYKNYIDLSRVYVINRTHKSAFHPSTISLMVKLAKHILKQKVDILYSSSIFAKTGIILYLLRLKKVVTLHEPMPHKHKISRREIIYQKIANRYFDRLVFLSDNLVDKFCDFYNYSKDKISIARLGYFDYLPMLSYEDPNINSPYILFFGRICDYKGLEFLFPAMDIVHQIYPNVKLVIAGGGRINYDISKYTNCEYIEIRNRFIGMEELVGLLRGCMFSVAPYRQSTQSGLLLNSFSLCVPMVASNIGIFKTMIKDEENGILVEPCNVQSLADGICQLLENPNKIAAMKDNIKNNWQIEMSWEPIADIFIDAFNKALNRDDTRVGR